MKICSLFRMFLHAEGERETYDKENSHIFATFRLSGANKEITADT
jgi:hypothetical protein